jgi:hypothetical protein
MPWFSTRAQILQTALAFVACAIAAVKAWPDLVNLQWLSFWPLLMFASLIFGVLRVSVPTSASTSLTTPLTTSGRLKFSEGVFIKYELKLGEVWKYNKYKLVLRDIKHNQRYSEKSSLMEYYEPSEYVVDLEIDFGIYDWNCGSGVQKSEQRGRYLVPERSSMVFRESGSLFRFGYIDNIDGNVYTQFVVIEHINFHSKTASGMVFSCFGKPADR